MVDKVDGGDGDADHHRMAADMINSSCGGRLSKVEDVNSG